MRSGCMYQMYAYLRSQEVAGDQPNKLSNGLLFHPSVAVSYDEYMVVNGDWIRFATVDLTGTTAEIRQTLLDASRTASKAQS